MKNIKLMASQTEKTGIKGFFLLVHYTERYWGDGQ